MKPLPALFVLILASAACSESPLPTETKFGFEPDFEIGVQEGICPAAFTLFIDFIKGLDPEAQEADANRDGFACYLVTHVSENEVFRTWTDNNIPLQQIGGCPNSFELLVIDREIIGRTSDLNGDGRICRKVIGNGTIIEIDNNHRT